MFEDLHKSIYKSCHILVLGQFEEFNLLLLTLQKNYQVPPIYLKDFIMDGLKTKVNLLTVSYLSAWTI